MHNLRERTVISVKGKDASSFLQGLLTQDINKASSDKLLYSLALTSQGKILYDCFILKAAEEEYLLDLPLSYLTQALEHLQSYKLRAKVEFVDMSASHAVYISQTQVVGLSPDPRGPSLWHRGIIAAGKEGPSEAGVEAAYHSQRVMAKIVDYDYDLEPGTFFPWIVGLSDAAVDYNKGCYIGQEVNARARWKEGSRKKLMALSLPASVSRYAPIMQEDKNVGTLLGGIMAPASQPSAGSGVAYLALALVKHELLDGSSLLCGDVIITQL